MKQKVKGASEIIKDKIKEIDLVCEWNVCNYVKKSMPKFMLHVAEHVATISDIPTCDGFLCLWRRCGFVCLDKVEMDRHIYFHAYHSRIKAIGAVLMKMRKLQCSLDDQSCNVIPDFPEPFQCLWENCNFEFVGAQEFYWHAQGHAKAVYNTDENTLDVNYIYQCYWKDCKVKTKTSHRLIDHVRTHTKEKMVACPQCGSIFASYKKLYDHCYRNLSAEYLCFECSHCKNKFATEGLLREHIRSHVNQLKCPHCEMTCPSRSTLENHIRYRHTDNKPFKCPQCDKRFTVQGDVIKHLVVHSTEKNFLCPYPNCNYSCRSFTSSLLHEKQIHSSVCSKPYLCHICESKFPKGSALTLHLKKSHAFHWPAGHSRFRYSKDVDGYYKLQTTRIESIELAEEILNEEADRNPDEPRLQIHFEESEEGVDSPSPSVTSEVAASVETKNEAPPSVVIQTKDEYPIVDAEVIAVGHQAESSSSHVIIKGNEQFLPDFLPHPPDDVVGKVEHESNTCLINVPALILHDSSQFITLQYDDPEPDTINKQEATVEDEEVIEGPAQKRLKFSAF